MLLMERLWQKACCDCFCGLELQRNFLQTGLTITNMCLLSGARGTQWSLLREDVVFDNENELCGQKRKFL